MYLQWQWSANYEYMWNLDDISLTESNPTPANDIALGDFFYSPSSLAQPVSQIATDTFGFGADLSNRGSAEQTNVVLRGSVTTDTDVEIWADSLVLPSLAVGVTDSFFSLPNSYAPELPLGAYKIKYSVRADALDERLGDNSAQSPFLVTASTFSKEVVPQFATLPADPADWYVANMYQMSAGSLDQYQVGLAQFAFATDPAELPVADVEANIYLFRVGDDVDFEVVGGFDASNFFSSDLEWVGFAPYAAPDTMANFLLQTTPVLDPNSGAEGVLLDNGARYILAIEYAGANNVVRHAFNDDVNMLFQVSTLVFTDQWYLAGFGSDLNAVLRMSIRLVTTTDNKPLAETSMKIVPNPVVDAVNLAVNFDKPTDATITIADMTGRVIVVQDRQGLTQENLNYPVAQLAPGTYLARIATAEGTLTKKFVKM
ncbi:MAG: T9SS type A sorting domain-containing protein [Lewinellaceae bacterium]|nr:T9SS type A sorting domain-containing protein [Lewinellaceae bacterium]